MGTETYPKKGASNVGEQEAKTFLDRSVQEGYQQVGSSTSYPGSKSLPSNRNESRVTGTQPFVSGGNGAFQSCTYPNSNHKAFPSEKGAGNLPSFPGSKPKEA